ncbi:MAG: GxxExxY protein [Calditrichaeota bacterium]|nr:MAG: GxxExxY protein [Calditrichota bacterium]
MSDLLYPEESYAIVGAYFTVYNKMGAGFTEQVYQECLEIEFEFLEIPFVAQKEFSLQYRGRVLEKSFRPDFVCYEKIIVEIKAISAIINENKAQIINYLHASHLQLELLINFGHTTSLEYQRFANSQ